MTPRYEEPPVVESTDGGEPVKDRAWEVVRLIGQGLGRNEISKATGVPAASVSRIAQRNGLSFDRAPRMEAPLQARLSDLKLNRMGLAEGLAEDVAMARVLLRTAETRRDYAFAAKAISDLTQALRRMEPERTESEGQNEAKSFLTELQQQLTTYYQQTQQTEETQQ